MDSDLNETTSLWWIKTCLPWIKTQAIWADARMVPVRAHTGKDAFQVRSTVWCRPKTLRVRTSRWNGKKRPVDDNCRGNRWRCHAENDGRGRKNRQRITVGMVGGRTAEDNCGMLVH